MSSFDKDELEKFCILAKSSTGGSRMEALIQQVLNSSNIYVFSELLCIPSIQNLRNDDTIKLYSTLELFAYGKYEDYMRNTSSFLELSPVQIKKLRQLSILSAAASNRIISYDVLKRVTGVTTIRELEDLIIDTIYAGVLQGKLNQKEQLLRVHDFVARDVKPSDVDALLDYLNNFDRHITNLMTSFENGKQVIRHSRAVAAKESTALQDQVDKLKQGIVKQIY